MLNKFQLNNDVLTLRDFSINTRRDLHMMPELSGKEVETSKYCKALMHQYGFKIKSYVGHTGFIADLIIDDTLTMLAFRTDMDGLEMEDLTNNQYTSKNKGCAHNCGHDTHMSIALTTANYLANHPQRLRYNVRFIFQMAEEDMRIDGANKMVELGCMHGVSEVYALHNDASQECGKLSINDHIMSSYGSMWTLDIQGKSAHSAMPNKGLDAIREGARIIADMDYIVAKKTDPFSPAVFVCGMFNAGTMPNVIAGNAQAKGTIRAMDNATNQILINSFVSIVAQSELRGYTTSFSHCGYPAVVNHTIAYQRVVQAAQKIIPVELLDVNCRSTTGSEDFSYMIEATKNKCGAMFFLGSGNKEKGIENYLHATPYFVEDDFLLVGAQIFINLATDA
ncbi:M20 metallopeptidase family protein [Psychromonas sp. CD1]|uniref:M20 metallopeptidase family protein n=1 Tax=Psychromonas sp. CD1 TaxID=1979839 RepID=UPI000B9A83E9|nr:amidohydrolase [Psychromonas sp. CD1]